MHAPISDQIKFNLFDPKRHPMRKSIVISSFMILVFISPPLTMYACKQNPKASKSLVDLAKLVNERLAYMKAVAAYKWENQLAIEDLEREEIVIQSSMDQAGTFGLDSISTRMFFEQQIEAAKQIQRYWFKHWEKNGFEPDQSFGDLKTEIRPALLELGRQILSSISELKLWVAPKMSKRQGRLDFMTLLTTEGLRNKGKQRLFKAVMQIKG